MKNTRRKKSIRRKKFVGFVFLLILIIGVVMSVCLFSPIFNLTDIEVLGNDAIAAEEIENLSGIPNNINIFRISKKQVEKSVKYNPRIEKVTIKRKLPNKILISVEETYPELVIPYMSGYLITNEYGKVIEMTDDISDYTHPVVCGIEVETATSGEVVGVKDKVSFDVITECILKLKENGILNQFESLDFSNVANFTALTKEGVTVIFGKLSDMDYKLSVLHTITPQIEIAEGTYIDLATPQEAFSGRYEPKKEETEVEKNADNDEKGDVSQTDNTDTKEEAKETGETHSAQ